MFPIQEIEMDTYTLEGVVETDPVTSLVSQSLESDNKLDDTRSLLL